ncbi:MAG: hypothetical protein P4L75_04320, partial [Clostridia bacterium]|nr:hypothetical protein [Clostridia bacterium]
MLLCNENVFFPSLVSVGGDWDMILSLIEERSAFFSHAFHGRTTYLSAELYFCLKPLRRKTPRDETQQRIIGILKDTGGADSAFLKSVLMLESKALAKEMEPLLADLSVTVLRRGRALSESWTTFVWGTSAQWENEVTAPPYAADHAACRRRVDELLSA